MLSLILKKWIIMGEITTFYQSYNDPFDSEDYVTL